MSPEMHVVLQVVCQLLLSEFNQHSFEESECNSLRKKHFNIQSEKTMKHTASTLRWRNQYILRQDGTAKT